MKLVAKIAVTAAALGLPLAAYAANQQHRGKDGENEAAEKAEQANAPKPAISKARAQAIALRVAPGQVSDAEYEKEGGGWRWSFDIRQNGKIHEIGVDATTGKIVENAWENAKNAD